MNEQQETKQETGKPPAATRPRLESELKKGTERGEMSKNIAIRQVQQVQQEQQEQLVQQGQQKRSGNTPDERQLSVLLHRAGIIDMEIGMLLAQEIAATRGTEEATPGAIVEQIRRQKPWLFQQGPEKLAPGLPGPTAGLHGRDHAEANRLETLALKARQSQSPRDMQQYLRLRRAMH